MPDNNLVDLKAIFNYVDQSRHLPGFRLDPYFAPFFALLLPDILNAIENIAKRVQNVLIHELPLRRGSLGDIYAKHRDKNASKNVDFVAVSEDRTTALEGTSRFMEAEWVLI